MRCCSIGDDDESVFVFERCERSAGKLGRPSGGKPLLLSDGEH